MAAVNGTSGTVGWSDYSAGSSDVTSNVKAWSLDYTADALDSTDFASGGNRAFIAGLKSWGGSYDCNLDGTDVMPDPGTITKITLTSSTGRTYAGTALMTSLAPSVGVADLNALTVNYQGTGALTIT